MENDSPIHISQISQAVQVIKSAILQSQIRTAKNVNSDVLALFWQPMAAKTQSNDFQVNTIRQPLAGEIGSPVATQLQYKIWPLGNKDFTVATVVSFLSKFSSCDWKNNKSNNMAAFE